jgi:hypothetical protein
MAGPQSPYVRRSRQVASPPANVDRPGTRRLMDSPLPNGTLAPNRCEAVAKLPSRTAVGPTADQHRMLRLQPSCCLRGTYGLNPSPAIAPMSASSSPPPQALSLAGVGRAGRRLRREVAPARP